MLVAGPDSYISGRVVVEHSKPPSQLLSAELQQMDIKSAALDGLRVPLRYISSRQAVDRQAMQYIVVGMKTWVRYESFSDRAAY